LSYNALIKNWPPPPRPMTANPMQTSKMNNAFTYSDSGEIAEYCDLNMRILTRERQKITQRGRLTGDEDLRLDEIDAELEYWEDILNELE
jgi:hypothetical protein